MRTRETEQKKGPRDIDNISWATGIVFIVFSHFIFTLLTNVLGTSLNYWQQRTENMRRERHYNNEMMAKWEQ
jgi:uncharacterized membrane protein YidH (DUF202 family)